MLIKKFVLDESILARTIYSRRGMVMPFKTAEWGLVLNGDIRSELNRFVEEFLAFHGYSPQELYFRLDAFLQEEKLLILEINVELQDGWGVALNLLRAASLKVDVPNGAELPKEFIDYGDGYRAEFELACSELSLLGHEAGIQESTLPRWWVPKHELDGKIYLARFARHWRGHQVLVPVMHHYEETPWEELPENVIFKFNEKYGDEALRARCSVIRKQGRDFGKGKFVRQCYNSSKAVAQEWIEPMRLEDGSITQVVILCAGVQPITGYLQVVPQGEEFHLKDTLVINDRSAKAGPLAFEN